MKKYYAVSRGRRVGVLDVWSYTKKQVEGYSWAKYQGFDSIKDAIDYMESEMPCAKEYLIFMNQKSTYFQNFVSFIDALMELAK